MPLTRQNTLSVIFSPLPPSLSTPEAISYHRRKQGVPLCKIMSAARRVAAAPSQAHSHYLIHHWREGIYTEKKREESKSKSLLSTSCCPYCLPNLTERWVGRVAYWQALSFSLSLSELRPGSSWACSIVPEENCQSGLLWLNTESRSFIKELICYSLPLTHSFSFSHSLPFSTGSLCHTPTSFSPALFILCSPFPFSADLPPSETPMVSLGYNVAFSVFPGLCVCVWNHCWLVCRYGK